MIPNIQNSFVSGELSPSFLGHTDKPQYRNGASTMRNCFVRYQGGASSRAGFAYCGTAKQAAPNAGGTVTSNPPRLINFQLNINQGFALEFGDQYMRIISDGAYVIETPQNVTAITQASPGVITIANHGYSNGDWVFGSGISGMTEFNSLTWIVQGVTTNTFTLTDLFGNVVDTTNFFTFTSGGTFARIYTVVSPYAAVDLDYLKFTENANLMNLVCWNQLTNTAYPPYTLTRITNTNWVFSQVSFVSAISPPTTVSAAANNSTTQSTWYSYEVTAVDNNGNESVASKNADVFNNDISINAGSNIITWNSVGTNISNYNIYAATPIYVTSGATSNPGFTGVPYGLVGSALGLQFTDTNFIPDFTITPPTHQNPFAPGGILDISSTAAGTNYTQSGTGIVIHTSTGTGAIIVPIIQNTQFVGGIVQYGGQGYAATDTATVSGVGSGATVSISVGPQTGTYPGSVQYYQQRLVYADTINQPDTYFMSQPGRYNNFDTAIPTVDSDAITGTPWAVQINGIQFMIPSIQGLLTFTGNGVWLISGGNTIAITPSDQNAQAQSQVGCSATVPPLFVNLHVLYVQAKNSVVRDIAFSFLTNVFTGTDITVFSNHLFFGYTLRQWAYSEEPFKTIWAIRNDGIMLSLCYVKEQEISGWARHDTNGLFTSICSVIEPPINENVSFTVEPPIDAIYTITKRYIVGHGVWAYYSERANNRIWQNIEDCFCVDAGLFYPLTYPNATLTPSAASGTSNISAVNVINGGSGYINPTVTAVDSSGEGSGATFSVTISGGAITSITPIAQGTNYTAGLTSIVITDSAGSGAVAQPIITDSVLFTASSAVFTPPQFIYISNFNDNTVSALDSSDYSVVTTITVGTGPIGVTISPNGATAWVCNNSSGNISVISTSTNQVVRTISTGGSPWGIAFTPDGTKAYITNSVNSGKVWVINTSTFVTIITISVGSRPKYIAITPDGTKAYTPNNSDSTVSIINTATNTVTSTPFVGGGCRGVAISPDSSYVYVSNQTDGTISVLATSSGLVTATITLGFPNLPDGLAVTLNGEYLYVCDLTVSVAVISTATNTVTRTLTIAGNPVNVAMTADGATALVINKGGQVYPVNISNNSIGSPTVFGNSNSNSLAIAYPSSLPAIGTINDIIRVDGGKATITEYISPTQVMADITQDITITIPNDPNLLPVPAIAGTWSLSTPTMTVSGLNHLEGMQVTGLADGGVITPQTVVNGQITLQQPASAINVGLAFLPQVQTMYLDAQEQVTIQGRRKDIQAVTARLEASRGVQVGTNQPDASTQPNNATVPWTNMKEIKERNNLITASSSIPLFTGDSRILVPGDWNEKGQVAFQQPYPLPMNLLACICEYSPGDLPG